MKAIIEKETLNKMYKYMHQTARGKMSKYNTRLE